MNSTMVVVLVGAFGAAIGFAGCLAVVLVQWGGMALVAPRRSLIREAELWPWRGVTTVASDGTVLAGAWRRGGCRVVVLVHGFGEGRAGMRSRADLFDPIEWSALAIDMRGRGESGGEYCSFGESRCADLTAWLDWSRAELGEVERVVVWGRSMGAGLALRFAMAGTRRVDCLVVEAPFANLSGVVSGWLRRKWLPGFAAKAMVWRAGRIAGGAIDEPTPLAAAACVRVPVLILHGARDGLAPLSEAESICRAIGPSAKLVVVPEAGHADVFELGRGAVEVGLRELIDGDVHDQ